MIRKTKRFAVYLLAGLILTMHSAVVFADEEQCKHDWTTYSFEKVYEGDKTCYEHEFCILHEIGYNVIDICKKCGEKKQNHFTQLQHNYVSR